MYKPLPPFEEWDHDEQCYVCTECGAAYGFGFHNPTCSHSPKPEIPPGIRMSLEESARHARAHGVEMPEPDVKINLRKPFWKNIAEFFWRPNK